MRWLPESALGLAERLPTKGPVKTVILSGIISCAGFALFPLWVTEKWEFVIASVAAGIGFGFLLGAPLNVLVSEASKTNKGTALGTLSLVRQIGLTLAPTLYAGFITAGFDQIGDEISSRLSDSGYSEKTMQMIPEIDSSDVSSLQEQIERIPVPEVKTAISDAIHASVASGYDHLYAAAAVISLLVIAAISIPAFRRQKR